MEIARLRQHIQAQAGRMDEATQEILRSWAEIANLKEQIKQLQTRLNSVEVA